MGLETTKPSALTPGQVNTKEMSMQPHIVSLLDSLAQTSFIWNGDITNGDITINVSGGAVDWIGLCAVMILLCETVRKR